MSRARRSSAVLSLGSWLVLVLACVLAGWASVAAADEKAEKAAPESGWVRLPLPEYDRLIRAAHHGEKAPLEAAITSSASVLDAEAASPRLPRLQTTLELVSLSDKPQLVPLPDLGVLYGAESSGDPAAVAIGVSEPGLLQVQLAHRGRFVVRLRSVPNREERGGTVVLTWTVPDSPSNRFSAALPGGHESVTLSGGTVEVAPPPSGPGPVRVAGTLRRGETVRLSYGVSAARAPEEKLLASVSESRLYRLGEKSLGVASRVRIEVLRGTLRSFTVEADPDFTVTSAWAAENTVTSFERDPSRPGRLVLTLAHGVTGGPAEVFWLLERKDSDDKSSAISNAQASQAVDLPDVGLPDFLRGETAVAVISPRPLVIDEGKGRREGYERIDETDLPTELREMADSTILLALRRVGSAAPALSVQVLSFPDAEGLAGVIDRGRILTIAARDGMRIDRWQLDLQTRESLIRLPLPEGAEIWSLQVDGKPVRPLTELGQLVVALGRGEKVARSRRLELVVAMPGALVVAGRGTRHIAMPKLPLPITHAEWDLLLPDSSQYRYAGGSVVPMPTEPVLREGGVEGGVPAGVAGGVVNNAPAGDNLVVSGSGRLSGRALDAQGGALPGVNVTIVRQEGSYRQSATTDAQGFFLFNGVPAGTYRIVGALSGFQGAARVVPLAEGANLGADLKMELAAAQSVVVTGETPLVDTSSATTSYNVMTDFNRNAREAAQRKAAAQRKEISKDADVARIQRLSDEERASLQRTSEAGVAAIAVELPTEGKRLHFEGNLLVDEAVSLELEVRPVRHGWFVASAD